MTVHSNVNPNFPIPGIDQDSRGFRDNFSTIKSEIEDLQSKTIQLTGDVVSDPVEIGSGQGTIAIPVYISNISNINLTAAGANLSVQFNNNGIIDGKTMYINGTNVGINVPQPNVALDVVGNVSIRSPFQNTRIEVGSNLRLRSTTTFSNIVVDNLSVITIQNSSRHIGIGRSFSAGNIFVANATVSNSSITGALVITGGVGIGGNIFVTGNVIVTGVTKTIPYIVSALPSATVAGAGARSFVTDSNSTIITRLGLPVTAGGANAIPVYSDGANWIVG